MVSRLAVKPLVMKVFAPSITSWSPSRLARVRSAFRSDPQPGSVSAMPASRSPLASRGSQRCDCSDVPQSSRSCA